MAISSWHPATRAACWMSGALFFFGGHGGNHATSVGSPVRLLDPIFRSACGLIIILPLVNRSGWGQLRTGAARSHVIRNISHFAAQYGWVYGIALIPMAEVFAIEFSVPVWTVILATVILRERLTAARMLTVALGLTGALIILQPRSGSIHPAALAVLLGAMAFALAYIMTKKLSRTESPLSILFYMTTVQLALGLAPAAANWAPLSLELWPWLFLVGAVGLTTHYCLARAMALADASVVVPMDFLLLRLIAVVGAVFFDEKIQPLLFLGAALILSGNLYSIYAERNKPNL